MENKQLKTVQLRALSRKTPPLKRKKLRRRELKEEVLHPNATVLMDKQELTVFQQAESEMDHQPSDQLEEEFSLLKKIQRKQMLNSRKLLKRTTAKMKMVQKS